MKMHGLSRNFSLTSMSRFYKLRTTYFEFAMR